MGKSRTVRVTVSPKSAELTIGLDRAGGTPGVVKFYGSLFQAGTIILIRAATVELWVNGTKRATTTTGTEGRYHFDFTVAAGSYNFYTRFPGNSTYLADDSPPLQGAYAKLAVGFDIDVNPTFGAPPLATTIIGRLYRADTSLGLGGKTVDFFRNGVKLKSMITKKTTPGLGSYQFSDTISAKGGYDYHVFFAGDAQFEGCEAHGGATADGDGEPGNGEPPEEHKASNLGPLIILAAILLGDDK